MTRTRLRVAVFASGHGSNFQALLDEATGPDRPFEIACCISEQSQAGVLERAVGQHVPTAVLHPRYFADEEAYGRTLLDTLDEHAANFIALAGFLKKIPVGVIQRFPRRIVNIHPALLPSFGGRGMYGRRVHEAVLEHGVHWTGATVHIVEEAYDTGPIVLQEPVPVFPSDTPDDLAARVLQVEHRIFPEALRLLAQDRVTFDGRRVRIEEPTPHQASSHFPSP